MLGKDIRLRRNAPRLLIKSSVFRKEYSRRSRIFKLNEPRCLSRTRKRSIDASREFIRTQHPSSHGPILIISTSLSELNKQVESGTLKLIDEKKALAEITTLRRSLKQVSSTASVDESIAADRAKIEELRKVLDDPENKKVQARWEELKTELDALRAEGNKAYEERSGLFDQRTTMQKELVSSAQFALVIVTLTSSCAHRTSYTVVNAPLRRSTVMKVMRELISSSTSSHFQINHLTTSSDTHSPATGPASNKNDRPSKLSSVNKKPRRTLLVEKLRSLAYEKRPRPQLMLLRSRIAAF